ncbi:MAG: 2-(1,2-epoxy-1,2-dihydrophenyl)acetyl-CoA isomerase, partial [Woeseiaceae bacterium]
AQKSLEEVLNNEYRPIFNLISDINIPVIASVHGSAAGIGLSLALCCDLMIMSDDAFLLAPFTSISLAPDGGMNWFLVHQLGYRKAFQVCIEAERIDAKYCVEYGLANKCVPAEDLFLETLAWARRIAKRAPLSVTATKKIMRYAASHSWSETYDIEVPTQQKLINSNDFKEGVEAFIKKREPKFNGN